MLQIVDGGRPFLQPRELKFDRTRLLLLDTSLQMSRSHVCQTKTTTHLLLSQTESEEPPTSTMKASSVLAACADRAVQPVAKWCSHLRAERLSNRTATHSCGESRRGRSGGKSGGVMGPQGGLEFETLSLRQLISPALQSRPRSWCQIRCQMLKVGKRSTTHALARGALLSRAPRRSSVRLPRSATICVDRRCAKERRSGHSDTGRVPPKVASQAACT